MDWITKQWEPALPANTYGGQSPFFFDPEMQFSVGFEKRALTPTVQFSVGFEKRALTPTVQLLTPAARKAVFPGTRRVPPGTQKAPNCCARPAQ